MFDERISFLDGPSPDDIDGPPIIALSGSVDDDFGGLSNGDSPAKLLETVNVCGDFCRQSIVD